MEKIWLKNYQEGVPQTINPDQYPSLVALFEASFQQYKKKACYSHFGKTLNYQQVDLLSQKFAAFLQKTCHLAKGDRVAIMLPNCLQYPISMFGILKAGMIVVNVNPLYTARELKTILMDSGARCIIVLANFAHVVEQALPQTEVKHVIVTQMGDLLGYFKGTIINFIISRIKKLIPSWQIASAFKFKDIFGTKYNNTFERPTIKGEDIAYLQYTGGTTAQAKGAMLTHRNMVANILQACAWITPFLKQHKIEGGIITALPLYHIFSLTANCLTFLRMGIVNILISNPRDIPGFVKELKRQPFALITGVNTLFNALLNNKEFCKCDFSKFKFTLGGGMAVQKAVAQKWKEVTGVPLIEAYGLTETCPAVTINPLYLKTFNNSIGLPLPSTEIKIVDENNNELNINQAGELCVKGPQVMKGYWQQPEKTSEVIKEGWLHTGDIAKIDEKGFIYLVDRKKDIIIVSGFNVYPNEVEDVIATLKGVNEVAVIGKKSVEHGEVVKAFIVKSDPSLTQEQVIAHCHKGLTGYKIPKEIEFRETLPKSNVGKVLRRLLKDNVNP